MSLVRSGSLSSILLLLTAACGDGEPSAPPAPSVQGAPIETADPEPTEPEEPEVEPEEESDEIGLPCDVKKFLALNCQRCHGADAKNGTPLLTRDDLLAVAKKDAAVMVADRMLLRISATEKPMPPTGKGERVSDADLEMFSAWVERGLPAGQCEMEYEVLPLPPAMPTTPASP